MIIKSVSFAVFILTMLGLFSCTKEVTNNVPVPISLPQAIPTQNANSPVETSSGGVINGGGGKGVQCLNGGKKTVQVLDIYEARTLYNLDIVDFGDDEEKAKEKLALLIARHLWNPWTIELTEYAKLLKEKYLEDFIRNIRFIAEGQKLKLSNDSHEPILEQGCEPVQIAFYYDESVLLVDKTLWNQLNMTNKMGLLAHEFFYFAIRREGITNSMSTRKLVGQLFSTKGARPRAEGVPADSKKFIECRMHSKGFDKGSFFMFRNENEQKEKGMELVFTSLGNENTLFRMSTFVPGLKFAELRAPQTKRSFTSMLLKESYPTRQELKVGFTGTVDGYLRAELSVARAGGDVTEPYEVKCRVPSDFSDLEPEETEPGYYEHDSANSIDKVRVLKNGLITVEETRQVGGPGGLTNAGVVPYPTVCRYKQTGFVQSQNELQINYQVTKYELGDLTGLTDTAHCNEFIEAANRIAAEGNLNYTIRKSDYKKIE